MNRWKRSTTRWMIVALLAAGALAGCSKGSDGPNGKTSKTTIPVTEEHGLGPSTGTPVRSMRTS